MLCAASKTNSLLQIEVRVDEKVGHNSQGFLPVFVPHFGGIWQGVRLHIVPAAWIDETQILAIGTPATGTIDLELPIKGTSLARDARVVTRYRCLGSKQWSGCEAGHVERTGQERAAGESETGTSMSGKFRLTYDDQRSLITMSIPIKEWQWWSPSDPVVYELELELAQGDASAKSESVQRVMTRAAFRSIQTDKRQLLLNGQPIVVRGLLNWGYAPPGIARSIQESHFRREIQIARSYGFNLMKFCLWVPPAPIS